MEIGELLTRGSVWLALSLYVTAEIVAATRWGERRILSGRWLNSVGLAAFIGHVACAFHFDHEWSHTAAYADTARQTAALFGWNWGGGLYVNYAFGLVWLADVGWAWVRPENPRKRARWITWILRGFFLFMIFNGAVVFAQGSVRWFGMALCLLLVGSWWPHENREPR